MKKIFPLLLAFLLLFHCSSALAAAAEEEAQVFDGSVFQELDGYVHDPSDGTWEYSRQYVGKDGDSEVAVVISAGGDQGGLLYAPFLFIQVLNTKNDLMDTVYSFYFIIDGNTKYAYQDGLLANDPAYGSLLGYEGKALVEAFANCTSVSMTVKCDNQTIKMDLDQEEVDKTLKAISKNLIEYKVWDYITYPGVEEIEAMFPLTIKTR